MNFYPIIPPKVLLSGPLVRATQPRQSQRRVPWALASGLQGMVWCKSNFQLDSTESLVHRCTASNVAASMPPLGGNSMTVEYASVSDVSTVSAPDIVMPSGLAPSARQSLQGSILPPAVITCHKRNGQIRRWCNSLLRTTKNEKVIPRILVATLWSKILIQSLSHRRS